MPRMTHPDLPDQPIDVHPTSVGVRGKAGWVLDEDPTSSEDDTVDLGPDVAAGDAVIADPASAGTHEE